MARGSLKRKAAEAAVRHPAELKSAVVAGAAADTNLAVAGIKTSDQLVLVLEFPAAGGPPVDRTGDTSVTSAGNLQSTDDTTGNTVVALYYSV